MHKKYTSKTKNKISSRAVSKYVILEIASAVFLKIIS